MNLNKTRTWNRQTPMNGELINAEVDRIYSNFTELDGTVTGLENEDANLQTQVGDLNSVASKILSKFSVGEVKDLVKSLNYLLAIVDEQDGDLQNNIDLKANKAGDTFTGAITIPNGTLSGHAVNKSQLDLKVDKSSVVNSDSSTSTVDPVSAYQVKLLRDDIIAILGTLGSTNEDLDTMQEVVNFIQENKETLDEYMTSKVNVADIINDLVSDVSNKPASAHTVFVLKGLLDALSASQVVNDSSPSHNLGLRWEGDQVKARVDATLMPITLKSDIVNNTTSTNTDKPLAANQGKILADTKIGGGPDQGANQITDIHYGTGGGGYLVAYTPDGSRQFFRNPNVTNDKQVVNGTPAYAISLNWEEPTPGVFRLVIRINGTAVWNHVDGVM